ncbi:MAG: hypothetical protein H7124_08835 [Phycisphaerales bacterium]|nr:hypothetical protein [Hyphomonadaceae bacterium]
MSEQSWVLKGIDPATRARVVAEAERRGASLADYITDVVLQGALLEQMFAPQPQEPAQSEQSLGSLPENFVFRHRIESLERRLSLSVSGLDGAVHGLDSSVYGLAARVDEAEALATDTADALQQALADIGGNLGAMRKRISDAEDHHGELNDEYEGLRAETAQHFTAVELRIEDVEGAARAAQTAIVQVAVAHEALKYAVADDFSAFTSETTARLGAGLEDVRAAAEIAAQQADTAVAHLITELRGVRIAIEDRVAEGVAETRQRMHTAFAEAAERLNALGERVNETERLSLRGLEQLRTQIADVEDAGQTAIEETAESLRQAGTALAAEFARATRDNRTALDSVHADLSSEIAELRERQAGGLARLKQVDVTTSANGADIAALRDLLDQSIARSQRETLETIAKAQADRRQEVAALTSRLAQQELDGADNDRALKADIERVEACTLAALDKMAADRAGGDALLERQIEQRAAATDAGVDQLRQRMERQIQDQDALLDKIAADRAGADALLERQIEQRAAVTEAGVEQLRQRIERQMQDQDAFQSGALARLKLLDSALSSVGDTPARLERIETDLAGRAIDRGFDERLLRLEARAEGGETDHALAVLRGQIAGVAAQLDAQRQDDSFKQVIEELRSRVTAFSAQAADAGERVHGVARMVGHLSAQHADAMTQSEERLRKLELAVADVRLDQYSGPAPSSAAAEAAHALEQRIVAVEARQSDTFDLLREDLGAFIADNVARLEALESAQPAGSDYDVAAEFQALRTRIEERILGVEQRSVRALEQVADTMAVLEKRFNGADERAAQSA